MLGVFVNVGAIIIGSVVGLFLKKSLPERLSKTLTTAIALAVLYIGVDGMLSGENTLVLVISMVVGCLIGTLLKLDERLKKLGERIESKFKNKDKKGSIAEGFVSATLLYIKNRFFESYCKHLTYEV